MLVMLSGDPWGHNDLVLWVSRFALSEDVRIDDTCSLHFELDETSEIEGKVESVLVVGDRADRRDDQLPVSGHMCLVGTEVRVLVKNACIFFAARVMRGVVRYE